MLVEVETQILPPPSPLPPPPPQKIITKIMNTTIKAA
jgi:hypothetical protein